MNIKEEVGNLIAENKISEALEALQAWFKEKESPLFSEALGLTQRFGELNRNIRKDLISYDEGNRERARIIDGIFKLVDTGLGIVVPADGNSGSESGKSDQKGVNVNQAGIVGEDVNLSGEYVAGGNIHIQNIYYGKEDDKKGEKKTPGDEKLSASELDGLKSARDILVSKLNMLRQAVATTADVSVKFQYQMQIKEAEKELNDLNLKIGKD